MSSIQAPERLNDGGQSRGIKLSTLPLSTSVQKFTKMFGEFEFPSCAVERVIEFPSCAVECVIDVPASEDEWVKPRAVPGSRKFSKDDSKERSQRSERGVTLG